MVLSVIIIVNCITLALDDPSPAFPSSTLGRNLAVANYVFIALFTVEAVLKIIALGFVLGPNTYLRSGWNCLDFLVVCVSFLDFTSLGNLTAVRC
ncbi:EF-hand domain-containing protein, partial [Haematococcus lacustris]